MLLSWSGGKDSAVALHRLQQSATHEVVALVTTVVEGVGHISGHGVAGALLDAQAAALGLPVEKAIVPAGASNAAYEAALGWALAPHIARGVDTIAYGDLHLADIRAWREALARRQGMRPIFPVWTQDTARFAADFLAAGFRAVLVCVDLAVLDAKFTGRLYDEAFLASLPPGVDPCGENGEFHTFVFDGPNFAAPVPLEVRGRSVRDGFGFCELGLSTYPQAWRGPSSRPSRW